MFILWVISSLPELTEMKRLLDMHTTIATSLLDQIKKRKLDIFFETEEKLMSKTTLVNLFNLTLSVLKIFNNCLKKKTGKNNDGIGKRPRM